MEIKKLWLSGDDDCYTLSIRMKPKALPMVFNTNTFPPIEPRISLDEALNLGVEETHHTLHHFSREELIELKQEIERTLFGFVWDVNGN